MIHAGASDLARVIASGAVGPVWVLAALAMAAMAAAALAMFGLLGVAVPALARLLARAESALRRGGPPVGWRGGLLRVIAPMAAADGRGALPVLALALVGAGLLAGFVRLAGSVLARPGAGADALLSAALTGLRTPDGDRVMIFVTSLGDWPVVTATTLAAAGWLYAGRHRGPALGFAAVMALSSGLVSVLKPGLGVARPHDFYDGVQAFSFPSGHATSTMTLFGLLAWLAWRGTGGAGRWALVAGFAALAALVALSRLYLGAHWPSDVAAGLMLGATLVTGYALAFRGRRALGATGAGLVFVLAVWAGVGSGWAVLHADAASARYHIAPRLP